VTVESAGVEGRRHPRCVQQFTDLQRCAARPDRLQPFPHLDRFGGTDGRVVKRAEVAVENDPGADGHSDHR
jgi:hypothetical protein